MHIFSPGGKGDKGDEDWELPKPLKDFQEKTGDLVDKAKSLFKERKEFSTGATSPRPLAEEKSITERASDMVTDMLLNSPIKLVRSAQLHSRLNQYVETNEGKPQEEAKKHIVHLFDSQDTARRKDISIVLDLHEADSFEFPYEIFKMPEFQREDLSIVLPKGFIKTKDYLPDEIGVLKKVVFDGQVYYEGGAVPKKVVEL